MTGVRCLVWAMALTPQVFYLGSQSPFLLTKTVYVSLLGAFAALALILAWRRNPFSPGIPPALLAPAAFVAYAALRGPWWGDARPEMAAPFLWGAMLLVAWPTAAAAQTASDATARTVRLMVCLGGLTAAYALLQSLGFDLPVYRADGRVLSATFHLGAGRPPFATLGNPNFLGEYLAPLLPLAVAGAMLEAAGWRWTLGCAAGLMAAALPLTLARGPWLAAAVGVGATVLLRPRSGGEGRRLLRLAVLLALAGLLAVAAMEFGGGGTRPLQKLTGTFSRVMAGGEGRQLWWAAAAAMVADRPLAGVGTGRFREEYPAYQGRVIASRAGGNRAVPAAAPVESPHNDYLQVAAELGIPGLLLLLGALGTILWSGVRAWRRGTEAERGRRAGALGGLAALLAAALVGYPLHTATGVFLLAVLSALAVSPSAGPAGAAGRPRWQMALLVAVTALGFWQAAYLLRVYAASLHLHRGTEALLRGRLDAAIDAIERAHQVGPRDSEIRAALGQAYLTGGRPDLALPHLEAALAGFDSARLRTLLGRAHLALGRAAEAEEAFRRGVAWFPGAYAPLYLSYGAFLAGRGRDAEAARELARALAVDPNLPDTYYVLGTVRARGGDTAGATDVFRHFLRLARLGDPRAEIAAAHIRRAEGSPPRVDNGKKPVN